MIDTAAVPKAELHVHLEGTATPALVRKLAARNKVSLADDLFDGDGEYAWTGFMGFLKVYDEAARVIRTPEDYRDVTFDYLAAIAREGAIYAEITSSPDHAAKSGIGYWDHVQGMVQGIEDARAAHGIEGYVIVSCVRHFGVEAALRLVREIAAHPHERVVGFGMGGDEAGYPPGQFAAVFRRARDEAGLQLTAHAGEFDGPASVREALDTLGIERLGHGVRAFEDAELVAELAAREIVLECCPTSNIATGVYAGLAEHPWPRLRAAGCKVTLNSDDPPYFHTSLGGEYEVAARHFGASTEDLRQVTRDAIGAGFAPREIREDILARAGL